MDPTEKRKIGSTGPTVSRLGFGCGPLGELFFRISDADADATLQAAWDAGIRYFDTAPYYGMGKSEHRVGTFLRGLPRDQFALSTKVGRVLRPRRRGAPPRRRRRWRRSPLLSKGCEGGIEKMEALADTLVGDQGLLEGGAQ